MRLRLGVSGGPVPRDPGNVTEALAKDLAGLGITTGTLWLLVRHLGCYYLTANLVGIALATAWNFVANSLWTWGGAQ